MIPPFYLSRVFVFVSSSKYILFQPHSLFVWVVHCFQINLALFKPRIITWAFTNPFSNLYQDAGRKAELMLSWDVNNGVGFYSFASSFYCVLFLNIVWSFQLIELILLGMYQKTGFNQWRRPKIVRRGALHEKLFDHTHNKSSVSNHSLFIFVNA